MINLVVLGIDTNANSNGAAAEKAVFSSAESTASSIIFTQRESLAYTTKYSLWLAGSATKRDVQIARALLAQRLNVIDIENQTMGSRLQPGYLSALKKSDELVNVASDGFLSIKAANSIKPQVESLISEILSSSRAMVVAYQQELDQHLLLVATERKQAAERNLMLLLLLMFLTSIFLVWISRTILDQFEKTKEMIDQEVKDLETARSDLETSQLAVKTLRELNDSKNDFWVLGYYEKYPNVSVQIMNRWGNKVFESEKPYKDNWDGKNMNGEFLPTGTYFYIIDKGNGEQVISGFVEFVK